VILGIGAVARAASPLADGVYKVGALGEVRIVVDGSGHVTGTFISGSSCAFDPNQKILSGDLVGSALVGKVTVCLEGPGSCGTTRELPFFAVPSEGLFTAFVSLPDQCTTPALDGQLTLSPTHRTRLEAATRVMRSKEGEGAKEIELAIGWLRRASQGNDGTLSPENEVDVLLRLGTLLNRRRVFADARSLLDRATRHKAAVPAQRASAFFNLGCAEAQLSQQDPSLEAVALGHLRQAVTLTQAGTFTEELQTDGDLGPLRALPEFRKLLELSRKGAR
jgi:hypothetical protein